MNLACIDLSWLWSLEDYWYAVISAVIGAGIGIFWTIRHFQRQTDIETSRCVARLKECLQFNLDRLEQAQGQLEKGVIPNYPLDTAQLNHWLMQAHDVIDTDLLRSLDWQRFQLDHISSKFIVANQSVVSNAGNLIQDPIKDQYFRALVDSLLVHVKLTRKELPPLIGRIPPAKSESK